MMSSILFVYIRKCFNSITFEVQHNMEYSIKLSADYDYNKFILANVKNVRFLLLLYTDFFYYNI